MRGLQIKCSSHNEVKDCNFQNNKIGCLLENPYYGNGRRTEDIIISLNNFLSNNIGLKIDVDCYYNQIYHNNFIGTSTNQASDAANNVWDDGYPSGGNYWFDYTGKDNNGDGIGDTPYLIPGGSNKDNYPIMEPLGGVNRPPYAPTITGTANGKINIEYEYTFDTIDIDGDNISYYVDWGDDTNSGWTEYVPSGTTVTLNHTWTKMGAYNIRAKAKDENNAESGWEYLSVTMPLSYNQNNQQSIKLKINQILNI
jgi:hypothetical protein